MIFLTGEAKNRIISFLNFVNNFVIKIKEQKCDFKTLKKSLESILLEFAEIRDYSNKLEVPTRKSTRAEFSTA